MFLKPSICTCVNLVRVHIESWCIEEPSKHMYRPLTLAPISTKRVTMQLIYTAKKTPYIEYWKGIPIRTDTKPEKNRIGLKQGFDAIFLTHNWNIISAAGISKQCLQEAAQNSLICLVLFLLNFAWYGRGLWTADPLQSSIPILVPRSKRSLPFHNTESCHFAGIDVVPKTHPGHGCWQGTWIHDAVNYMPTRISRCPIYEAHTLREYSAVSIPSILTFVKLWPWSLLNSEGSSAWNKVV